MVTFVKPPKNMRWDEDATYDNFINFYDFTHKSFDDDQYEKLIRMYFPKLDVVYYSDVAFSLGAYPPRTKFAWNEKWGSVDRSKKIGSVLYAYFPRMGATEVIFPLKKVDFDSWSYWECCPLLLRGLRLRKTPRGSLVFADDWITPNDGTAIDELK